MTSSGGQVSYIADAGDQDWLKVTASGGVVTFQDTAMSAGAGCTQVTGSSGHLPAGALTVSLGDVNDKVEVIGIACKCGGGAGDDLLIGAELGDTLIGGSGRDVIDGGGGGDLLRGVEGDDTLDGGVGADTMQGGPGVDTVSYATRTGPVAISLDGLANDGTKNDGGTRGPRRDRRRERPRRQRQRHARRRRGGQHAHRRARRRRVDRRGRRTTRSRATPESTRSPAGPEPTPSASRRERHSTA